MGELVPIHATPAVPMFSMGDIERVALAIAKGGLFGSKDPNAVLTLCLLAQAEGQHPAVVFRDYHIISGKPAKKADAMLRDFINSGGKVEWHQLDDTCADATFTHPSGSARIEWTLERAKKAQLTTAMWNKYPRQMLRSRVISEGVRTVFPGATSGLYEVGEVQDITGNGSEPIDQQQTIEHATEETPPEPRKKLDGPYTSKTALWQAARAFDRELRGCGDVESLDIFVGLPDSQALLAQLERDAPNVARTGEGLPEEFEPIIPLMSKLRTELMASEQSGEAYEPTPLDAG